MDASTNTNTNTNTTRNVFANTPAVVNVNEVDVMCNALDECTVYDVEDNWQLLCDCIETTQKWLEMSTSTLASNLSYVEEYLHKSKLRYEDYLRHIIFDTDNTTDKICTKIARFVNEMESPQQFDRVTRAIRLLQEINRIDNGIFWYLRYVLGKTDF